MLKKNKTERLVWLDLILTLAALEIMAYFCYGLRALCLGGMCVLVSLAAEFISLRCRRKKFTADDLMCTSDALIIALMLPAAIDFKIPAIACCFAVIIAKNIFGGRENMIFSPAAAAYVFMLTSWKKDLLSYPPVYEKTGIFEKTGELVNSASYTFNTSGKMDATDYEILLGGIAGPMGAVSILLLIVAAVVLIFRRDISAGAFFGTMFGTVFLAYLCPAADTPWNSVKYTIASNMILFAAIYIISDKRIAPRRNYYAFFYGLFISVFSYALTLTTSVENVIVTMSVIFTPAALGFKKLEAKIEASDGGKGDLEHEKA